MDSKPSKQLKHADGESAVADATHTLHSPSDATALLNRRMRRYQLAYGVANFAAGPAFGGFASYVSFQIQNIGYIIGREPGNAPGTGCSFTATACRVPMAGSGEVNLTSFLLYLNAIAYAVSGALVFFVAGVGDHMNFKREQYVFFLVIYGALCLPAAALTGFTTSIYNTLSGLYVVFNIVGFLIQVWGNIFIPYTMREMPEAELKEHAVTPAVPLVAESHSTSNAAAVQVPVVDPVLAGVSSRHEREMRGVKMSVWGSNALNLSSIIFYLVVLGLTFSAAMNAGLTMTTVAGAVCVVLALVAWPFLPRPGGRALPEGQTWLSLPFTTFMDMFRGVLRYPDAFRFLLAYTIYNDTLFAFGTVTGTLFQLSVRPSIREFTCYSLVGPVVSVVVGTLWMWLFPRTKLTLRQWSMICYGVVAIVPFWALLGISDRVAIGFKHRWEFYFMAVIQNAAGAIVSPLFRVLFSELFPKGSEIKYFGFQLVLACSTTWIPQVVNGPIVDATNNIRLPAAVCLPAFLLCFFLAWWTNDERGIAKVEREQAELDQKSTGDEQSA